MGSTAYIHCLPQRTAQTRIATPNSMDRTPLTIHLLAFMLCAHLTHAQPGIQWQQCLGGAGGEFGTCIQSTIDGGYVLSAYTTSNSGDVSGNHGGSYDAWVVKIDAFGALQWQTCLGGSGGDQANAIQQTADEGFIVAGSTASSDGDVSGYHDAGSAIPRADAWVVKLDADGAIQWQKCLGGWERDDISAILQAGDGGYICAGSTYSNDGDVSGNHGDFDAWVVKLDAAGDLQWQKCLGGTGTEAARSIAQTMDGGYIVTANTSSNNGDVQGNHGSHDAWVVKLSASGVIEWQECLGGSGPETGYSILQSADQGYLVAGQTKSTDGDVSGIHGVGFTYDAWAVKLDALGAIQWQRCLGGTSDETAYSAVLAADSGYVLAGATDSYNGDVSGSHGSGDDMWVVKLDRDGDLEWQKCLGGGAHDGAESICRAGTDAYMVAGHARSNNFDVSGNHGDYDVWVVKLGFADVGLAEHESGHFTVTPNPAQSGITLNFPPEALPEHLALLDAAGRTLCTRSLMTTTSSFAFDLSGHESGLYLIQVRFRNGTLATKRIIRE